MTSGVEMLLRFRTDPPGEYEGRRGTGSMIWCSMGSRTAATCGFKDGGNVNEALRVCAQRAERGVRRHCAESLEAGTAYYSMASVYYKQSEYGNALEYYEKCLRIRLAAFGPEHPSVGNTCNNVTRRAVCAG